jgi:hypothetical protein
MFLLAVYFMQTTSSQLPVVVTSCSNFFGYVKLMVSSGTFGSVHLSARAFTFGGRSPKNMMCMLNSLPIQWVNEVKYLGVYYKNESSEIDISTAVGKIYGCFTTERRNVCCSSAEQLLSAYADVCT